MDFSVNEIAADVFRISYYAPELDFTFNQYLVRDEEPLLYHTGFRKMFGEASSALRRIIDPAKIRWLGYSHFEPDECGALNQWLDMAPAATVVCGPVGGGVVLDDYADRTARILRDDEVLTTGRKRFLLLSTPHLPHGWDATLLFEETEATLFCSDLFLHAGNPPALVENDIVGPARDQLLRSAAGPFAHATPWTTRTADMMKGLTRLNPRTLALMHGSAFRGDGGKMLGDLANVMQELAVKDAL
ncbi:MBL fold metallo-hydrolase [Mesorhizobium sp. NPDC059054]|uniref:MBL fold metallo-hydrolase n=1 Tax=Mesorhizobium sp. NPDC059054 TaxID=3346711 RepID=UPI0036D1037B